MKQITIGKYGPQYSQFIHKAKEAIKFLKKKQQGECLAALHRDDIGDIDIVWGENNEKNKGYGLKHILEKHGDSIRELGFEVEDFIPIVVQFGTYDADKSDASKLVYSNDYFRFVVAIEQMPTGEKKWLLTSFDIRKKPNKKAGTSPA